MSTHIHSLLVLGSGMVLVSLAGRPAAAGGMLEPVFNPANFSSPTTIDNPYWPLVPGTTFTYHSLADDECEVNDVHVTDATPIIAGILTREVHDEVWEDDDCDGGRDFRAEDTLDRYAQDDEGNVWYMGEDTAEYCDRDHPDMVCSTEGSWEAGVDGALPGFVMLADPIPGISYPQEFLEGEAEDMAKVLRTNASVSLIFDNQIDPDDYEGCLKTKEWSPLEKGVVEHKFYCPGVGLVLIHELKSKTVREELVNLSGP
jgi:hypothetical protein